MELKVTSMVASVPVHVVHVDGNLDSASYESFQAEVGGLLEAGARHILVDLTHCPYVSSAGLRALQTLFNQLRALEPDVSDEEMHRRIRAGTYKSPHIKVLNLSKEARASFEMAGFDMFIEEHTDLKTALASF